MGAEFFLNFYFLWLLWKHWIILNRVKPEKILLLVDGHLYLCFACLSVWVFGCLYPINVKAAKAIGPKFCVGHHLTPEKVYGWWKFKQKSIFIEFCKSTNFFFYKIRELFVCFCFVLQCIQRENVYNWNIRWARSALRA